MEQFAFWPARNSFVTRITFDGCKILFNHLWVRVRFSYEQMRVMESVEKKSLYVVHALCKVRRVSLSIHVQADYICWMEMQLLWFIDKVTFTFADGVGMITELV